MGCVLRPSEPKQDFEETAVPCDRFKKKGHVALTSGAEDKKMARAAINIPAVVEFEPVYTSTHSTCTIWRNLKRKTSLLPSLKEPWRQTDKHETKKSKKIPVFPVLKK